MIDATATFQEIVEDLRTMARVAGQASVESLDIDRAAADARFAGYCTAWADALAGAMARHDASLRARIEAMCLERGVNDELNSNGYVYRLFGFNTCKKRILATLPPTPPRPPVAVLGGDSGTG